MNCGTIYSCAGYAVGSAACRAAANFNSVIHNASGIHSLNGNSSIHGAVGVHAGACICVSVKQEVYAQRAVVHNVVIGVVVVMHDYSPAYAAYVRVIA